MYHNVMIATDLSAASSEIVGLSCGLFGLGLREVILAHALDIPEQAWRAEIAAFDRRLLAEQEAILRAAGLAVRVEVVPGPPAVSLVRFAEQQGCELIVIGARGRNLTSEILLGGAAYNLLHGTRLPTLVLRPGLPKRAPLNTAGSGDYLDHLLLATDFSEHAELAFQHLRQLVRQGARRATILHVRQPVGFDSLPAERKAELVQLDQERLERLQADLRQVAQLPVETCLAEGHPGTEILALAERRQATLIIVGTQGRSVLGEYLLGSVSHFVARQAPAPTLLIPKPR